MKKTKNGIDFLFAHIKKHDTLYLIAFALLILVSDQILKSIFDNRFFVVRNTKFLYGLGFSSSLNFFILTSLLILFALISVYGIVRKNVLRFFIFPVIVSLSNYADRIFRKAVIDYIHFNFFPMTLFNYFNLADAGISVFVAIFVLLLLFGKIEL